MVSESEVLEMQEAIKNVFVSDGVKRYIVEIVRATRESGDVYLGSSPRGSLSLFRASQARAVLNGRDYVLPDDVKALSASILAHRIVVDPASRMRNITSKLIVEEIIHALPVPGGEAAKKK